MQNRVYDYQYLRQQNYQLKNQITDLKNGFDLNRDVLKILQDQIKQKNPKVHLFFQVISRLTGVNNQIMITNMDLLIEKNKILADKRKLQNVIDQLRQKNKELLIIPTEYPTPKQIQLSLKQQVQALQKEVFALNQLKVHQNIKISELQKIINEKQAAQQKKPLIPSSTIKIQQLQYSKNRKSSFQLDKKYESKQQTRLSALNQELMKQNKHCKKLIEQLEYRLTLLARIYQIQPSQPRKQRNRQINDAPRQLLQSQLNLLMFALNNTKLQSNDEQSLRLTITNRMKLNKQQQNTEIVRMKSCPHKFTTNILI